MELLHRSGGRQRPVHCQRTRLVAIFAGLVLLAAAGSPPLQAAGANGLTKNLEIRKGDHIGLIGNTLADRMQHDGWLETQLQARFPSYELTIRNLGYSADELTIRLRSADFGMPDEWLSRTKTDIVFAFFGYNESFGDQNRSK